MSHLPSLHFQDTEKSALLALRLGTLVVLVVLLTIHVRSLRVFKWEQSVSGGVLVTFTVALLGLSLCAGVATCGGKILQVYICTAGAVCLAVNAMVIYRRWRHVGELTQVVAELLIALGVPLKRQVMIKVILSAAVSMALLVDIFIVTYVIKKEKLL